MNILDFYKMNNFLNKYFGCILPASKTAVTKCLKLIWNHSGIISGTYFSPFQGVYYLYRGLRRAPKSYFGLILDFWIIFLIFCEWIILLNILDSIEWIFRILFWIESFLGPMKKWTFKMDRPELQWRDILGGELKKNPPFFKDNNNNLLPIRPWFNSDAWKIE